MSRQRAQASQTPKVAAPRAEHAADRRLKVGEALPAACDAKDLARAFGCSVNTIYDWHLNKKLRRYELATPFGSKRWSGKRVQAALDGPEALTLVARRA